MEELLKFYFTEFARTHGTTMNGELIIDMPLSMVYQLIQLAFDDTLDGDTKRFIFGFVMRKHRGETSTRENLVYAESLRIAREERADRAIRKCAEKTPPKN